MSDDVSLQVTVADVLLSDRDNDISVARDILVTASNGKVTAITHNAGVVHTLPVLDHVSHVTYCANDVWLGSVQPVYYEPLDDQYKIVDYASYLVRSVDNGNTWHEIAGSREFFTGNEADPFNYVRYGKPVFGCDNGNVIALQQYPDRIYVSTDYGSTWTSVFDNSEATDYFYQFLPAVTGNNVYVMCVGYDPVTFADDHFVLARSSDGGATWGTPITIPGPVAQENYQPHNVCFDTNGVGVMVFWAWDVDYENFYVCAARSGDNGDTWTNFTLMPSSNVPWAFWFATVATDNAGKWLIVAEQRDGDPANGGADREPLVRYVFSSINGGQTWSTFVPESLQENDGYSFQSRTQSRIDSLVHIDGVWYLTTMYPFESSGVMYSIDDGINWLPLELSVGNFVGTGKFTREWHGGHQRLRKANDVYVLADNDSIYRSHISPFEWGDRIGIDNLDITRLSLASGVGYSSTLASVVRAVDTATGIWEGFVSLTDTVRVLAEQRPAFVLQVAEAAQAGDTLQLLQILKLLERVAAKDLRYGQYTLELVEALRAQPQLRAFLSELVSDAVSADETLTLDDALILLDALAAQIQISNRIATTRTDLVNVLTQFVSAIPAEVLEAIQAEQALSVHAILALLERVHAQVAQQGDFSLGRIDTVQANTPNRVGIASLLLDAVQAEAEFTFLDVLRLQDVLSAQAGYETVVAGSLILALLARDFSQRTNVQATTEELLASQEFQLEVTRVMALYDELQAALATSQLLTIMVEDTLEGQAGDAAQVLGRYLAQPLDALSAWVAFRLGEEAATGWVMNTEGEMPLSEYTDYGFNSFCKVGDVYLGARDEGLYLLDGDTDDGEPIEAAVRTMMLDFGSPVMKRVQSAYIGYTSNGKLMLKVRTVSSGELKEQWYEAQELQAQAPREQMIRVGRGLRSRYWQFELVNVDGSDFELMDLELHPVYLNRRV